MFFPSSKQARRNQDRLVALITLAIACLIAWLTLTPVSAPAVDFSHMDKLYHLIAFASLILPCALLSPRWLARYIAIALVFAGGIELVQPHVGRSGEWLDFFADATGLAVGALIGWIIRTRLA